MKFRKRLVAPVSMLLLAVTALADFRYEETTRISGGSVVGVLKTAGALNREVRQAMEPTTSTVMVKGNRLLRTNAIRGEIIDLDRETITHIDHQRQQFSVVTFQQLRRQFAEAQRRLQHEKPAAETPPPMKFNILLRNTGARKTIAGLATAESILSMTLAATNQKGGPPGTLAMTNDMWIAPEILGYSEARDFQRRLLVKLGMALGGALPPHVAAMQADAAQGVAELVKEMSKLPGVPVVQILRLGTSSDGQPLAAASEAPLPAAPAAASSSVLLESHIEMTSFSAGYVDAARFKVPAGYKEVAAGAVK